MKKPTITSESWSACEKVIYAIVAESLDLLQREIGVLRVQFINSFLRNLGLIEGQSLSTTGQDFYFARFIYNDQEKAIEILSEVLKAFQPTQVICQILWGQPNIKRENIYHLLLINGFIDTLEIGSEDEIGSFLMLLNKCGIIKYHKRTKGVRIVYNPKYAKEKEHSLRLISPETPFVNLQTIWEILRNSQKYIYWFDKHFSKQGLEILYDEADSYKIKEVKILTSILSSGVNERLRDIYKKFKGELENHRNIKVELRIICDKDLLQSIHDRWIISERKCYNIPPINSLARGQYSEINETKNRPPFDDWWKKGLNIITEWSSIKKRIEDK